MCCLRRMEDTAERNPMKVRIKFAKYGVMKFIGHLDTMRFFQKAIRRAGIDVKYSEGFSPHQIMSFAAPLGVGVESYGEYMDLEVLSMAGTEEIKRALNQVMVDGVEILSVTLLPDHAKNAMASVSAASYRLHMKEGRFPVNDLTSSIQDFYGQRTIPYTKETKKNVIELDLKQGIYEMSADEEGRIQMLVNASSSGNIKPSMVLETFCQFAGLDILPSACQVTRLETYTDLAGEGEAHRFVPLSNVI